MSPDKISRQYHNLQYATRTLCDVIESEDRKGKLVEDKYAPQLGKLIESFKKVLEMLEEERLNQEKQRSRWHKKFRSLLVDAVLDETISEELKERIVGQLTELAEGVRTHEDS